ncbi:class I adenylate-forming enzyme family protein [Alicycliphilus sp. T452]
MNATAAASQLCLTDLFLKRVQMHPDKPALSHADRTLSYRELEARVRRWAAFLQACGLRRGQRMAVWSENRTEYLELQLAAARLGVMIACLNWRLQGAEQLHCLRLVEPAVVIVSARYREQLDTLEHGVARVIDLDSPDASEESMRASEDRDFLRPEVHPEDGFLILYTSGTTGLPKGAVISQRASIARAMAYACEYGIGSEDGFIAWSPFFHMAATDHSLATLMLGGHVIVQDGFSAPEICKTLERERIGWLMAMPGVIEPLIDALKSASPFLAPSMGMVGAMADLVPRQQIAELTSLVGAPYLNSFGSTETGLAPASGALLKAGQVPESLSKRESSWCHVRLVDDDNQDVPIGTPGNMLVRGPGLFSGYWSNGRIESAELADGWFHLGDVFVRHADGSLDFVDRSKYLIKTGGENVYPAEIERILLAHPDVIEAAVVRRSDDRWGEVPVAFIALKDESRPLDFLQAHCREHLAGYKVPKEFRVISAAAFPRNSTGKIQKRQVEALLRG